MNFKVTFVGALLASTLVGCGSSADKSDNLSDDRRPFVDRSVDLDFGEGFLWGGATASFQVEGSHPYFDENGLIAGYKDGKSRSKWDFLSESSDDGGANLTYGERAYEAIDQYHRYEEDIATMKEMNINSYRFSVMWTRIIPNDGAPLPTAAIRSFADLPTQALIDGAAAGDPTSNAIMAAINEATFQTPGEGLYIRRNADDYRAIADAIDERGTHEAGDVVYVQLADGSYTYAASFGRDETGASMGYALAPGFYPLNYKGIQHYRDVIDALNSQGVDPIVTIYHWDMPMSMWMATFRSWSQRDTIDYFQNYAEVLFEQYGQDVPYWITINEPFSDACVGDGIIGGVIRGKYAPEFLSAFTQKVGFNLDVLTTCTAQLHNVYTAHARVSKMYNDIKAGDYVSPYSGASFEVSDTSKLGVVIGASPAKPATAEYADRRAANMYDRVWELMWLTPFARNTSEAHTKFADMPYVVEEDYQYDAWALEYFAEYDGFLVQEHCMAKHNDEAYCASKATIPMAEVVEDWKLMAEVGFDMLGVNYYRRPVINWIPEDEQNNRPGNSWFSLNNFSRELGITIYGAEQTASANGRFDPQGLYEGLTHVAHEFPEAEIIITETGAAYFRGEDGTNPDGITDAQEIHDFWRIRFLEGMFEATWKAQSEGAKIIGMMPWSTFDNFEWTSGTDNRFGIVFVDYDSPTLDRYWKDSAYWYRDVAGFNGLKAEEE